MNAVVIGCGGIGCHLVPTLDKILESQFVMQPECEQTLLLVDGDEITERNLERQLFTDKDVGLNKAEVLALKAQGLVRVQPDFFTYGMPLPDDPIIFCCADNHAARLDTLLHVDSHGGTAIIAGNEYTDAEAYIYRPAWRGTDIDPRIYYPDILTDRSGSPVHALGCQGDEVVKATPQLAIANQAAANAALYLFWLWCVDPPQLSPPEDHLPIRHVMTKYGQRSDRRSDMAALKVS